MICFFLEAKVNTQHRIIWGQFLATCFWTTCRCTEVCVCGKDRDNY